MSNGDTSLRTRRQSNAAPSNGGRFPAAAAPFPPPSSSSRGGPPPQDGSRRNGGPPPSASSGSNSATARPKSNVGARLLKKRQSVSYQTAVNGGISLPVGVIPGVPSLPTVLPPPVPSAGASAQPSSSSAMTGVGAGGKQRSASPIPPGGVTGTGAEGKFAALGVDIELLAAESFRPEEYLKRCLADGRAGAQMDDLRQLRARLEGVKKVTEADLQQNVFKNYADFVVISKEISTLENEMLELKGVLEEWRSVPESLEGGWGVDELLLGSSQGPNRRTQRNSLADLATLYKSQLSALWEGVEGSQKLLPYIPGRHLIAESASFVELNSATYKPKQQVHLFLLNDAMLVSVKKRRGAAVGGKVRLVAERCFNLSEIVVVDLKDGGDLTNAVKIKRGKETFIFRTDKGEDKKVLLMAFKKVAEELMNKKRKEMLSEAEARKGDPSTLRSTRFDYDGSLPSSGFSPSQILGFGKDDPTGKDLSWIGDYADELSVTIAMRMFDEAVTLVEKGKTIIPLLADDPLASVLFRSKLDLRTSELVSALLQDLSDHSIRKSGVIRTTAWLLRLNQGEKARETFLSGRGTLVRKRARQIKFEGDISMYISELAMVYFTLIKNTCEWYMAAFKDNRMASGFVRWASQQVETYADMFRRQVYGADQDRKAIQESLEVTKAHGAMLRDVGLDFTFLLDELLRPEVPVRIVPPSSDGGGGGLRPGGTSAVAQARHSIFVLGGGTGDGNEVFPGLVAGGGSAAPGDRRGGMLAPGI